VNRSLLEPEGVIADAAPRALRPRDVELWRVDLDAASPETVRQLRATLSSDEEARAQRFCFERDRWRFIVARGLLRQLLASYVDRSPVDLLFRYGENGKPELAFPPQSLHFNLSHSERMAVYAFSLEGPVGIDIERIREMPDWASIAATCFHPSEVAAMRDLAEPARRLAFFRAWTRQEALLKATGVGLGGASALGGARAGDRQNSPYVSYRLHSIDAGDDFAVALATPVRVARAHCHAIDLADGTGCSAAQTFNLNEHNLSRSVRL